ncbi:2-dehydro-3-deoxygalactonokinase [Novosphingobium cyanobacteriorum]|uniref:2-dehydro-3-deoxygalactonokinase n=1 Tax=Novosphingobium cyanobacteriorum TaxID=3024215 RepID=A0ABT6CHL3_9SPHN|nr:2-dehydro-3-deoxygalactonokinase [Novosphingobium cyanobacteriorum]MDF8332778.1 2-dehydro-3-deoxygalactonokinase [Novosphingobium cyanobacteriorum]
MAPDGRSVIGDWGGTRLRLFLIADGHIVDRRDGPGTSVMAGPAANVLQELLGDWRSTGRIDGVTLCGMAGSPAGIIPAPYTPCPADEAAWRAAQVEETLDGVPITVLPGLSHRDSGVPEVMRGEETQIFGAMVSNPVLATGERVLALPGTHGKWVRVCNGAITGFRTAPTGELFAAITTHTSLGGQDPSGEGTFDQGFARGLARSTEPLAGALFEARAARLIDGRSGNWAQGYLSGLLIGAEAAQFGAGRQDLVLIGDPALTTLYARALAHHGGSAQTIDGEAAVIAGLAPSLAATESRHP